MAVFTKVLFTVGCVWQCQVFVLVADDQDQCTTSQPSEEAKVGENLASGGAVVQAG